MKKPTKQLTPEKHLFAVNADGHVFGSRRKKGDELELTEKQARYENVTRVNAEPKSKGSSK